jgi:hypothetical protein
MKDTVMVLTSKSLETMIVEGGTGNWAGREERLKHTKWVVATRNLKSTWTQGEEPHGSAFLIGRITGVKVAPPSEADRFVIQFDRYANLSIPGAWTNNRNPITYTNLSALGIDADNLEWKDFPNTKVQTLREPSPLEAPANVINQARAMIAQSLSIRPEAVKITVDF